MAKVNKSVVRNQAYRKGEFNIRERHNERKNECYGNGDIEPDRVYLNVHYKECSGTYEQEFNRMVEDGTISLRGLKKDAKVFDELVFDINTAYFEECGGYEYAKQFYEEAYRMAVKEIGGEQYILSAVMHADERNIALSEELGHDVYHYHLHVVYVPVVDKEIKWSKRCKDPALVGTVKDTIKQVSHSKKWPRYKTENGWINAYSLLQDHFYEHMLEAGYTGFQRGERGSSAQHLDTLAYKVQQEKQRASQAAQQAESQKDTLRKIENKLAASQQIDHTLKEIKSMGKTALNKVVLSSEDWKTVYLFAKEGLTSRNTIDSLKEQIRKAEQNHRRLLSDTQRYREANRLNPAQTQSRLDEIIQDNQKQSITTQIAQHKPHSIRERLKAPKQQLSER